MSDDGGASEYHETTIQCCNAVHNSVPALIKPTLRFPTIYDSVWGMGWDWHHIMHKRRCVP